MSLDGPPARTWLARQRAGLKDLCPVPPGGSAHVTNGASGSGEQWQDVFGKLAPLLRFPLNAIEECGRGCVEVINGCLKKFPSGGVTSAPNKLRVLSDKSSLSSRPAHKNMGGLKVSLVGLSSGVNDLKDPPCVDRDGVPPTTLWAGIGQHRPTATNM